MEGSFGPTLVECAHDGVDRDDGQDDDRIARVTKNQRESRGTGEEIGKGAGKLPEDDREPRLFWRGRQGVRTEVGEPLPHLIRSESAVWVNVPMRESFHRCASVPTEVLALGHAVSIDRAQAGCQAGRLARFSP
jgi:hypothetical protein